MADEIQQKNRQARLAQILRDNLKKRREQAKKRQSEPAANRDQPDQAASLSPRTPSNAKS